MKQNKDSSESVQTTITGWVRINIPPQTYYTMTTSVAKKSRRCNEKMSQYVCAIFQ